MASIVGLSKISMPRLDGLDTASARELRNYRYQMQAQLEDILSNIDTENLSGDLQERAFRNGSSREENLSALQSA